MDELPPLPEPTFQIDCIDEPSIPVFTDYQMRDYAEKAVKQEREQIAKLCEGLDRWLGEDLAAAIRARSSMESK